MNFDIKSVLNAVWLLSSVLLTATLILVFVRGLHRRLPWFVGYLAVVLGRAPILFLLRNDKFVYFYTYWVLEAITIGLSIFVIYEVYREVLDSSQFTMTKSLFFSLCVAWVVLATIAAVFIGASDPSTTIRAIMVLVQTVRFVQVGLLGFLLVGSMFYNFYWQSMPFGVVLGYGIFATVELVGTISRAIIGPTMNDGATTNSVWALSKVLGYQIALITWIIFAYRHDRAPALDKFPPEAAGEWLRPLRKVAE